MNAIRMMRPDDSPISEWAHQVFNLYNSQYVLLCRCLFISALLNAPTVPWSLFVGVLFPFLWFNWHGAIYSSMSLSLQFIMDTQVFIAGQYGGKAAFSLGILALCIPSSSAWPTKGAMDKKKKKKKRNMFSLVYEVSLNAPHAAETWLRNTNTNGGRFNDADSKVGSEQLWGTTWAHHTAV